MLDTVKYVLVFGDGTNYPFEHVGFCELEPCVKFAIYLTQKKFCIWNVLTHMQK